MSQPAPDNPRPRRPRTERGKRSKNGCQTCLTKRVKCDERRPVCHRCDRLKLCCEWPAARPSLTERRRGFGPIKGRICWSPKSIQPRGKDSSKTGKKPSTENDVSALTCQTAFPYAEPSLPRDRPSGHEPTEDPMQMNIIGQTSSPPINLDAFEMDSLSPRGETSEPSPHQTTTSQTSTPPHHPNQPHQPSPNTLSYTIPPSPTSLPTDDILCQKDMQALSFHRSVFAPLKSTQDASRSAHSLFLHRAFDRQMALHFLLAVSHNELQIYKTHQSTPSHESRSHYRRGSELLRRQMGDMHTVPPPTHTLSHTQTPTPPTDHDHLNIMLSFLYIYLFWMRRDRLNPTKLSQLSRTIHNYLHKHTIDAVCCLGELLPPITNLPCFAMAVSDQILLARILIYLYDRDGFCHFFGCGGSLASYVNAMPEKRRALWQISRIPFVWPVIGGGDGAFGLMQTGEEREHGYVLDVYFDLIVLHQEVNGLSQGEGDDAGVLEGRLRERLREIEQNASFIRLLAEDDRKMDSLPLMAYVTATVFYALRVYLNRATTRGFGSTSVDIETQRAQCVLLKIAYKTVATGPVQLLERFQWALLVAGMETSDAIHRDWVEDNISDPGIRDLLRIILREKAKLGGVIQMSTVRRLIRGG